MDVRFCDLCNESVPQADLDQGRAVVSKGRVVCVNCERAMSTGTPRTAPVTVVVGEATALEVTTVTTAAEPRAPLPPRTHEPAAQEPIRSAASVAPQRPIPADSKSTFGLWVAVLGLVFTAVAIAVFNERLKTLGASDRALLTRLEAQSANVAQLMPLPARLTEETRRLEAALRRDQSQESHRIQGEIRRVETEIQSARSELGRIAAALEALRTEAASGQTSWSQRIEEVSQRLAKQEDDFRVASSRLDEVEELARNPPVAALPVGAAAPGAPGGAPAAADAAWKALIPDLSNANSGLRWQAVDGMGQSGDPTTVPYLIPMLKDGDVFVRMAAARVLGNLEAPDAIPALIDGLEDVDSPVREAALVALHQITGRDFQFDPQANEAERARRLKAVRDWWKKTEEGGGFKKEGASGR